MLAAPKNYWPLWAQQHAPLRVELTANRANNSLFFGHSGRSKHAPLRVELTANRANNSLFFA